MESSVLELDYDEIMKIDLERYIHYKVTPHEFFGHPGREHYRLFAYLSTLFDGRDIVDVSTYMGSSALALSYNPTNTVHTFDIVDKVLPDIGSPKMVPTIKFYTEDLFSEEGRKKYVDLLLKAALIVVDVEPHEGTRELEFYTFMRKQQYQGMLLFDDICYFSGMRDVFWKNVSEEDKYDITNMGHWSGTGIVSFRSLDVQTTIKRG